MGKRLSNSLASEHDWAGEELRDSEARYRRLFEAAQDGILILDGHTGLITDVNPFLTNLLDYQREEFVGKKLWDFGPFRNIGASKLAFQELQDKEYIRYENLPLEAKGGRRINVEFVSNVYGVNGKRVIQCNIRDITARKQAEQVGERCRQSQKMEAIGPWQEEFRMTLIISSVSSWDTASCWKSASVQPTRSEKWWKRSTMQAPAPQP
jgi:PAS domain S-box-containing protein